MYMADTLDAMTGLQRGQETPKPAGVAEHALRL